MKNRATFLFIGLILFFLADSAFALTTDLDQDGILDHQDSEVIVSIDQVLPSGEYTFLDLSITNNSNLVLLGDTNSTSTFPGVKINAQNITVDPGAVVYANN